MDHPNSGLPEFGHFKCASRINPTCAGQPAGDATPRKRRLRLESPGGAGRGGRRLFDGVSHRLASPGACDVAVDPGDGAGGAQPAQRERARQQWPQTGGAKPRCAASPRKWRSTRVPSANLAGARALRPASFTLLRSMRGPGADSQSRRDQNLLCQSAFKIESRPAFSLDGTARPPTVLSHRNI